MTVQIGSVVQVKYNGQVRPLIVTDVHSPETVSGWMLLSPYADTGGYEWATGIRMIPMTFIQRMEHQGYDRTYQEVSKDG